MNSDTELARPAAVLDSNVIISGLAYTRGNPFEILRALERGDLHVYISPFILDEVAQVLRRTFHREEAVVEQAISFLRAHCTVIDPHRDASVSALSAQDNRVLDCAAQGGVQYLVTGDKGIQQLKEFRGIAIVSPAEFLTIVRREA
jgi:hypothetical protein